MIFRTGSVLIVGKCLEHRINRNIRIFEKVTSTCEHKLICTRKR